MGDFFNQAEAPRRIQLGAAGFDVPILYFRDDSFGLFFTADARRVRAALPSGALHPVTVVGRRAVLGIGAFNYIDTSIGSYGEVGVVVPVVHGRRPPPLLPLLREGSYPGFGLFVLHLPVTTILARDAGRRQWGYPKFTSDMCFAVTPEYLEANVREGDRHLLTVRVSRRGLLMRERRPMVTYSVKNGDLIRTEILQKGSFRQRLAPSSSFLKLGDHEVAHRVRELRISRRPFLSRYYVERGAILPAGSVIERGVRPPEYFEGSDGEGKRTVGYLRRCVSSTTSPAPSDVEAQ